MLSCKDITNKANEYLDNELSFSARIKVKLHLYMCIHCRNYMKQMKQTIFALAKYEEPGVSKPNQDDLAKVVQILKDNSTATKSKDSV